MLPINSYVQYTNEIKKELNFHKAAMIDYEDTFFFYIYFLCVYLYTHTLDSFQMLKFRQIKYKKKTNMFMSMCMLSDMMKIN